MNRLLQLWIPAALLLGVGLTLTLALSGTAAQAESPAPSRLVTGSVYDRQGQPVRGAQVSVGTTHGSNSIVQTTTQPDGRYALPLPENIPDELIVHIERPHFEDECIELDAAAIQGLRNGQAVVLPDTTLLRRIGPAFWLATLVFAAVLVIIATGKLHNTLAALLGATLVLAVSYLGHPLSEGLFVFDFRGALRYVDWNVIFLIMGMMIVIAVVERTGIFQWLAFMAYRVSGGRMWLLVVIVMIVAGVGSAFLDNVYSFRIETHVFD
jgi:hypothetical protein